MAIIVQAERKSTNWVALASTLIIIIVLFAGSYFIFFAKPELIENISPGGVDVTVISKLTLDPSGLINSPEFLALTKFPVNISPPTPGRDNPFKPF